MIIKKRSLRYAAAILTVCLLLAGTVTVYVQNLNSMLKKENYTYLEEVAQQCANTIEEKLESDLRMLQSMAVMLGASNQLDTSFWVDEFGSQELFDGFQRIGIILPNGQGYGQDVSGTDFSDRDYFKQAMLGNSCISKPLQDRITGLTSYTYAVPIVYEENIIAVLAAVINIDTYQQLLLSEPFMGKGYTYIVENNGEVVLFSGQEDGKTHFGNIFNVIEGTAQEEEAIRKNMLERAPGRFEFEIQGETRFLSYTPLAINDWYIVSAVSEEIIAQKSEEILFISTISVSIMSLVLLGCFILILYIQNRTKKKLIKLAYYNELTGLGNKNYFKSMVKERMQDASRRYMYCVMDVKRFHIINVRFGFSQGDELLRHIAGVLKEYVKETEIVSHFSADVFHLFLEYAEEKDTELRLREIAGEIGKFTFQSDQEFRPSMGFGVYVVGDREISVDSMGDMAILALNQIRYQHYTACSFYDEKIQERLLEEQEIENDMHRGIGNQEFQVYLQPKYSLKTGKIQAAEALVRWQHPQKGMIAPIKFIPLFEKNGFIAELDLYMFDRVCNIVKQWTDKGLIPMPVSVNQSRINLDVPGYINRLISVFENYEISPEYLVVEITESAFFDDKNAMVTIVSQLHENGIKVSMDDFGSGYSSLNMLKDIILDEIKIDKDFFNESADTMRGRQIVQNIISMAAGLNISIVAEGVETKEQVAFLKNTECQLVQGYFFAKPMSLPEFEQTAREEMS